ncbi:MULTISPECIES: EAL domain-containing protein [unclassified Virgibacillus]|uniref:EAL domain-containing protein n=1 Tax=unclassified Virgibacillus TaxID=2620237 RepID=UPI0024DE62D2|nr:EAL domain-containing protein [Virgibacillus sp. LDC-1]
MKMLMEDLEIDNIDFHHVFQPIWNVSEEQVAGYEALIRPKGFTNPELFFRYAKEKELLYEIDMGSIFQICQLDLKLLGSEGKLFINTFPSTLMNKSFIKHIKQIVKSTGVSPSNIVIEISEAEKVLALNPLLNRVDQLRSMGFLIALDDVGKGETTTQSIVEIQPDIAKLDRFYAEDLSQSNEKKLFIEQLLKQFKNQVAFILEGVEREEDYIIGKQLGIQFIQGFFLGRPEKLEFYQKFKPMHRKTRK